MPAPFRILGIDHAVLRAADPAAMRFWVYLPDPEGNGVALKGPPAQA